MTFKAKTFHQSGCQNLGQNLSSPHSIPIFPLPQPLSFLAPLHTPSFPYHSPYLSSPHSRTPSTTLFPPPPPSPSPPQDQLASALSHFTDTLAYVWRIPWRNKHKEVLWRLAVNGIMGAHIPGPCACGAAIARGRLHKCQHQFWDCPVAKPVTQQIEAVLGSVSQQSLWLLQPP